jgi:hypothetical protein
MTDEVVTKSEGSSSDVEHLTKQMQTWQARATDYEKKLERYKDIDPDAVKAMREDYEIMRKEAASKDPKKFDEWATSKETEIRGAVQKELDGARATAEQARKELIELKVVDRVFALAAGKFNEDTHEDVKRYVRERCALDDSGEIVVKGTDGKPLYAKGSTTKLMGAQDFVSWLVEQKPSWAKAEGVSGVRDPGQRTTSKHGGAEQLPAELPSWPKEKQTQWFKENPKALAAYLSGR